MGNTASDLISVIVPVYNSERHLRACIRSITGQTYPDMEISPAYMIQCLCNAPSDEMYMFCNSCWGKIFSRKLLEDIRFEDNGYEDTAFMNRVYCKMKGDCPFAQVTLY